MIVRLPGEKSIEAYWLANSLWRWRPLVKGDSAFSWLYWGRFAVGWTGHGVDTPTRRAVCHGE